MRILTITCCTALLLAAMTAAQTAPPSPNAPILVELFTSEGCSSCPPADTLLAETARQHRDVIVLSEHVTYWNQLGWADPFSSTESTQRQEEYAQRFGGEGPYTPQMVVNGTKQFVGSDRKSLQAALGAEAARPASALQVSLSTDAPQPHILRASVHLAASDARGRLVAVLAQNEGEQAVKRGENGGRTLRHVSIAREFHLLARVSAGHGFDGPVAFTLPADAGERKFHVVIFLQREPGGPILAAATT